MRGHAIGTSLPVRTLDHRAVPDRHGREQPRRRAGHRAHSALRGEPCDQQVAFRSSYRQLLVRQVVEEMPEGGRGEQHHED